MSIFFPFRSPNGSAIFGRGLPYLAMVRNPSVLSWIQMLITTKVYHLYVGLLNLS